TVLDDVSSLSALVTFLFPISVLRDCRIIQLYFFQFPSQHVFAIMGNLPDAVSKPRVLEFGLDHLSSRKVFVFAMLIDRSVEGFWYAVYIALRIAGHAFKGLEPTLLNGGGSLECLHFTSIIGPWGHELSIIGLGFAANLKILNFQDVRLVNDEIVLQIAKGCPLLTEWNLSWCAISRLLGGTRSDCTVKIWRYCMSPQQASVIQEKD
ncbi:RNI-like superfamily protein, partial [Tanacetum coccineum]